MDINSLPDDPAALKALIVDMAAEHQALEQRLRLLNLIIYGPKSEKKPRTGQEQQLSLFDEAEQTAEEQKPQTFEEACAPAHPRRKRGRRPIPADLPRVEIVHDLPESEKACPCGAVLVRIGEEVSEKLDIVPAKILVIRHIRPKYDCRACEGVEDDGPTVKTAPMPPQIIPQGIVTPGLLAHVAVAKGLRHLGCLAHVRRKFVEVEKSAGKKAKGGTAHTVLDLIGKLYGVEHQAEKQQLNPEQIKVLRAEKSRPILDKLKALLDARAATTPPKSLLGRAISYALKQWDRLVVYLEDGRLRPDNNLAENAIRPFAVGRKNWLFSGSPAGAAASAALYSLIETAKANGLEPLRYLHFLFEKLPLAKSQDDFRALLPQHLDSKTISA